MKIQGFIHFTTDNGKDLLVQNSLTKLGKAWFKARALQPFEVMRGIEEGFDFVNGGDLAKPTSATNYTVGDYHNNLCVYLLNLSDVEKAALSESSTTLPIYTTGTIDINASKVIGWASLDRSSIQAKQGVLSKRNADQILDDMVGSVAWEWAAGKATGTFNTVVIGYNVINTSSYPLNGMSVFRGLENNDTAAGDPNPSGYMLRPGVSGITSASEILLGGTTTDGKGRVKLDLVAKTRTELQPTDAGYDFPLTKVDQNQVIVGTKLFYFKSNYVWVYDTVAKTHTNTNIYTSYPWMFLYNGYLYVPAGTNDIYAYNTSTYANVSAQNKTVTNLLALPLVDKFYTPLTYSSSYVRFNYVKIGNYGSNYIITWSYNGDRSYNRAIVVTDPFTANTIVEYLPKIYSTAVYDINGEHIVFDYNMSMDDQMQNIMGLTANGLYSFGSYGTKMCIAKGNMISYKVYDVAQTIAADEVAKIEYSYKFTV